MIKKLGLLQLREFGKILQLIETVMSGHQGRVILGEYLRTVIHAIKNLIT